MCRAQGLCALFSSWETGNGRPNLISRARAPALEPHRAETNPSVCARVAFRSCSPERRHKKRVGRKTSRRPSLQKPKWPCLAKYSYVCGPFSSPSAKAKEENTYLFFFPFRQNLSYSECVLSCHYSSLWSLRTIYI